MIIMISGKQGSGKTTLANNLCVKARMSRIYAHPAGFAKAMRVVASGMEICAKGQGCPLPEKMETRELMNFIATDWGRKMDPDFWIPPVRRDIKSIQNIWKTQPFYMITIDDFRCKNEAHALDDLDDIFRIRLSCPQKYRQKRAKYWGDPDHCSEVDLDDYDNFDLKLDTLAFCSDTNAKVAYEAIMEKQLGDKCGVR